MASAGLYDGNGMAAELSTAVIPEPPNRYRTYNHSPKGLERRVIANDKRREQSLANYLSREFVAWDGEGINEADGSHTYVLLASSDGQFLAGREGLSTGNVFQLFLNARSGVTNIIYGGGYDINMFLRDVDRESLDRLYRNGYVTWAGYRLEWRPGKSFRVAQGARSFLLYDVLPFFQKTFVAACDEYLGTDWPYRDEIIREKANRGNFSYDDIAGITEYNKSELSTLVRLANELRERLHKVEIRVSRWDGPGAIAASLYKKYGTKSYLNKTPDHVAEAGRYAYAGGRFEIVRKGHSEYPCYQYDINSAYPAAIRYLPCLQHGTWTHRTVFGNTGDIARFGVYRVEVTDPATQHASQPQPLWMRNKDGTVFFSEYSHGWYWTPEVALAIELGGVTIHEGYEWNQECDHEPFSFVEALYNKRSALKKAGDGAHVGLKLGLNSLYGKLAQQIGWDIGPPLRLPPYHSLEWAGWITSHCRSQVYRAAWNCLDDVIAFETDAVFSRVPLAVPIGNRLGEWESTKYSSLTYLKSGMYYGTLGNNGKANDGEEVEKTRGFNKGTITRAQVIDALAREKAGERLTLPAEQTRFIGLGQAINQDFEKWRKWITAPRDIQVALNGKRIDSMEKPYAEKYDGWQETQEGFHDTEFSYQYPVAWINPDNDMASPEGLSMDELRKIDASECVD